MNVLGFWAKVGEVGNINECWPWRGSIKPNGYGTVSFGGRTRNAHRVAYELARGQIPDGLNVCHECDERACCNPNHLALKTQAENLQDMHDRGRHGYSPHPGEKNGMAMLLESDVRDIRDARRDGVTYTALAKRYNVSIAAARFAALGHTWRHVQ